MPPLRPRKPVRPVMNFQPPVRPVAPVRPVMPVRPAMPPRPALNTPQQPVAPQFPEWMTNGGVPPGIQQAMQNVQQIPAMPQMPTIPNAVADIVQTPAIQKPDMTYTRNITSRMLAPSKPITFNGLPLSKYKL